jgi:hypothetical protein
VSSTTKRLAVFSIRYPEKGGSIWVRAGTAFVNKDNSLNVFLDVLPLDGRLHLREAGERRDVPVVIHNPFQPSAERSTEAIPDAAAAAAGGH